MASPTKGPQFKTYNDPVLVRIGYDKATKEIKVTPDPFWVHPNEQVEWFCDLPHKEHGAECFTITFNGQSPFHDLTFKGHCCRSGRPEVKPDLTKAYKYSVTAPGFQTLDPQGGVKPGT
jgi:hypothetical protein